MSNKVVVHKGRTNVIQVNMGIDVSADTITSEIRTQPTVEAPLICEWDVSFVSDGTDGELKLELPFTITEDIQQTSGYMDLKRVIDGIPVPVFDKPLEVVFRGVVTE